MAEVKITATAQKDLINIFNFVASQSRRKAVVLLNAIHTQISSLH